MTADDVKQLLSASFADAQIDVTGGGAKFDVRVIAGEFDKMSAVARQQRVYSVLNEHIASGAIHAVTMNLNTPAESG